MNRANPFRREWQEHLAQSMRVAAASQDNVPAMRRILREAGATDEEINQLEKEGEAEGESLIQRTLAQQPTPHLVTDVPISQ